MRSIRGVTLVESLFAIAILAVSASLAVPALDDWLRDARRTAAVNALIGAVQLARSESAKRRTVLVLCASSDGRNCSGSSEWDHGWLLFANRDGDSPPAVDPDEPVARRDGPAPPGLRLTANRSAFSFRPFGARSSNGTITVCDERGPTAARAVVISVNGRPRVTTLDGSGKPLHCG